MARNKVPYGPATTAITASLLLMAAVPAFAADTDTYTGTYFSIGGGYTIQENSDFTTNIKSSFNDGAAARAAIGHDFGKIRLEAELAYRKNRASAVSGAGLAAFPGVAAGPATGGFRTMSYMANMLYDFDFGSKVTPYIGAGAGVAHIQLHNLTAGGPIAGSTSDSVFALQGIVGLAYEISRKVNLTLDYRYLFGSTDAKFTDSLGRNFEAGYGNHAIMAGLTFRFGGKEEPVAQPVAQPAPPPPPAAEPEPAPPPPPAPAPEAQKVAPPTFIVFFDFDSSKITSAGQKVIDEAVTAAKDYGAAKVIVTGYTDTAGTDKYNMRLSERRAKIVQDALVAKGIDAGKISTMAKGEADPLVPTGDGAREPQNRRTEIMIQ